MANEAAAAPATSQMVPAPPAAPAPPPLPRLLRPPMTGTKAERLAEVERLYEAKRRALELEFGYEREKLAILLEESRTRRSSARCRRGLPRPRRRSRSWTGPGGCRRGVDAAAVIVRSPARTPNLQYLYDSSLAVQIEQESVSGRQAPGTSEVGAGPSWGARSRPSVPSEMALLAATANCRRRVWIFQSAARYPLSGPRLESRSAELRPPARSGRLWCLGTR